MLFNLFRKNDQKESIKQHFQDFNSDFTLRQKKAIIGSLIVIAMADGDYDRSEARCLEETAMMLDYPLDDDINIAVLELMDMDREEVLATLNSLTSSQKDWYIITAMGMIHADGKTLAEELMTAAAYFENMGITPERVDNTLKKSMLFAEMLG